VSLMRPAKALVNSASTAGFVPSLLR
jgi:hypothetical protein